MDAKLNARTGSSRKSIRQRLEIQPLKLSDDEMTAVYNACKPLNINDCDAFLQSPANALRQGGELGPGAVYRAIRDVQRRYFPPTRAGH